MFQTKKQSKTPEELSEVEISDLFDKEFKVFVKMFNVLGKRMNEHSKKLELENRGNIGKGQTKLKNTITQYTRGNQQ